MDVAVDRLNFYIFGFVINIIGHVPYARDSRSAASKNTMEERFN